MLCRKCDTNQDVMFDVFGCGEMLNSTGECTEDKAVTEIRPDKSRPEVSCLHWLMWTTPDIPLNDQSRLLVELSMSKGDTYSSDVNKRL